MTAAPLRCFDPDGESQVTKHSTFLHFFDQYYAERINEDASRKPVSQATIVRRRAAVLWWPRVWSRLDPSKPDGPRLSEVTTDHLKEFQAALPETPYKRSPRGKDHYLKEVAQMRTMDELQIVLAAAGPKEAGKFRAGLLNEVPKLYVERVNMLPKATWTLEEAQRLATAAGTCDPSASWRHSREAYHLLARATLAFWFYTGHRATTYETINRDIMIEHEPGLWCLDIVSSVKTGKMDRVPMHRQLLKTLQELHQHPQFKNDNRLIPWPMKYGSVRSHHEHWQAAASLPENRQFPPQAWRRLHGKQVELTAFRMTQQASSQSLGHSNASTTDSHYVLSLARMRMPDLFLTQKLLF